MTYTFNCANCGEIELKLKPSQIPLKNCLKCDCEDIERVFAPTPTIYKCGGFYSTDNKFDK